MTSLKKIKMQKITSKNAKRASRNGNSNKTTVLLRFRKQVCFHCRMLLLALHISLICSINLS